MKFESMIRIRLVTSGILTASLFLTGCDSGAQSESTLSDAGANISEKAPDKPVESEYEGRSQSYTERSPNAMPDFALQDLEGNVVRLSDYAGKTVLINFWATWCGPCKIELPDLVEIQKEFADKNFVVLGISLDRTGPAPVRRFVERVGLNYPVLMGNQDVVIQFNNFQMIPTSFLLAPNHEKVKQYTGVVPKSQLVSDIEKVLEGPA